MHSSKLLNRQLLCSNTLYVTMLSVLLNSTPSSYHRTILRSHNISWYLVCPSPYIPILAPLTLLIRADHSRRSRYTAVTRPDGGRARPLADHKRRTSTRLKHHRKCIHYKRQIVTFSQLSAIHHSCTVYSVPFC